MEIDPPKKNFLFAQPHTLGGLKAHAHALARSEHGNGLGRREPLPIGI